MRRKFAVVLLSLFTIVTLFTAWPIRDHELVVRLARVADSEPVELYNEQILCTVLPDCFRVSHKLLISGTSFVTDLIVKIFHFLPGSAVTDVPGWVDQYTRNLAPYLVFRLAILVALSYLLRLYVKRWWVVAVVANVLLFWSSGVPIRSAVYVYERTVKVLGVSDVYSDLSWHFSRNSTIFLLEYDYLALAVVLVFPWMLSREFFKDRILSPTIFGVVLALTFENLAPVYIIAMLWSSWRLKRRILVSRLILIGLGWFAWIASLFVYALSSNVSSDIPLATITRLGYSINSEWRPLVIRLVIGFLVLPYILGVIMDYTLLRFGKDFEWNHELRIFVNGVVLGLCFSYLVGYFHSALATEFGRQSLGGQILLFLSGFLARQAKRERESRHLLDERPDG